MASVVWEPIASDGRPTWAGRVSWFEAFCKLLSLQDFQNVAWAAASDGADVMGWFRVEKGPRAGQAVWGLSSRAAVALVREGLAPESAGRLYRSEHVRRLMERGGVACLRRKRPKG